jgi:FkbM family methyltransferase
MYYDGRDHTQRKMLLSEFEPEETELVVRQLHTGANFLDVGAHVGWFTVLAGRKVGKNGRVFAFESFPSNFDRLSKNIKANGLNNVSIRNVAVSEKTGTLSLGIQSDSGSVTAGPGPTERVTVDAVTLDELLPEYITIDLLKIDVEGHEAAVLAD